MAPGDQPGTSYSAAAAPPAGAASPAQQLAQATGITLEKASWLLTNQPSLADVPPATLHRQLAALAQLLPGTMSALATAAGNHPGLLSMPPAKLQRHMHGLAAALGLTPARLARAALRKPEVLQLGAAAAAQQLAAVAEVLYVKPPRVAAAASEQPLLLFMPAADIVARRQALAAALGCTARQAAHLVVAEPLLLTASPQTLAAKLDVLAGALGMQRRATLQLVRRCPAVLHYSADSIRGRMAGLAALLQPAPLRSMLYDEAALLTRSAADVDAKLGALQQLLRLASREEAVAIAARRPALLLRSRGVVDASWRSLSIWAFDDAYKAALVSSHPGLLRLAPAELWGRCRWLRALMQRDAYYHSVLRELPPSCLGILLLHLPACWVRMDYLAQSEQETSMQIMELVHAPAAVFAAQFPEFKRWQSLLGNGQVGGRRGWHAI
jgi:hypothetical protein